MISFAMLYDQEFPITTELSGVDDTALKGGDYLRAGAIARFAPLMSKTIEAAMIARELLDQGIARRLAVICPPHLCEQWEQELREKFNLNVAVIQPSRIGRLEREVPRQDISIYQYFRHMVVSIDFIKSDRNRRPFIDNAPDLIIVDEAHTAARPRGDRGRAQQQRHEFLSELMKSGNRHLILTTATPHSGPARFSRGRIGISSAPGAALVLR